MTQLHVVPKAVEPIELVGYACAPLVDRPDLIEVVPAEFADDEDVFPIYRLAEGYSVVTAVNLDAHKNEVGNVLEEAVNVLQELGAKKIEELETELHHQRNRMSNLIGMVAKVSGVSMDFTAPLDLLYEVITMFLEDEINIQKHLAN